MSETAEMLDRAERKDRRLKEAMNTKLCDARDAVVEAAREEHKRIGGGEMMVEIDGFPVPPGCAHLVVDSIDNALFVAIDNHQWRADEIPHIAQSIGYRAWMDEHDRLRAECRQWAIRTDPGPHEQALRNAERCRVWRGKA